MDFKEIINNMKLSHEKMFLELCIYFNNCGDCDRKCEKSIDALIHSIQAEKIKEKSFRIPGQYDNKTNRELIELADRNNYEISFIQSGDSNFLEFNRQ